MFVFATVVGLTGCQNSPSSTSSPSDVSINAPAQEPRTATMWVHGMACPQCAHNVDLQLLKVPGVESVKIDMGSGQVTAKLSASNPPTKEQLSTAIENTGFTLKKIEIR
jgi:copper chaperone CopZ